MHPPLAEACGAFFTRRKALCLEREGLFMEPAGPAGAAAFNLRFNPKPQINLKNNPKLSGFARTDSEIFG